MNLALLNLASSGVIARNTDEGSGECSWNGSWGAPAAHSTSSEAKPVLSIDVGGLARAADFMRVRQKPNP